MSRPRAALLVAGVVVMGYAAVGALADLGGQVGGVLLFLAGVLILHDGVWLPLVLAAGALLGRFGPARHRGVLRVAAITGVSLSLVALPFVLGAGRTADNPSVLPLNYGRGLAQVWLALVALTVVALARTPIRTAVMSVSSRTRRTMSAMSRSRIRDEGGRRGGRKDSES